MSETFAEIQKRFLLHRRPYEETEDVTVTQLAASEHGRKIVEDAIEEEAATPRNEYGNIFHRVMEGMVRQRSKSVSVSWIRKLAIDLNASEKKEITQSTLKFWRGPWGKKIQSARRCYPELPFIYKTRHGILKGQIDLVFQANEGAWLILDYKTNRVTGQEIKQASKAYERQLAFYALVFKKLYGESPKKGVLYFSVADNAYEFEYQEKDFIDFEDQLEAAYQTVLK